MGRTAVLLVMGLSVLIGVFSYSLNKASTDAVENYSKYFKYSTARNIGYSGVSIVLHQIDNGASDSTFSGSLQDGTYNVVKSQTGDTIRFAVTATYSDTQHVMRIKMLQYPKPFPQTDAAVGLSSDSINFSMSGSPRIDGRDMNPDGTPGPTTGQPGITVPTSFDSSTVSGYSSYIVGGSGEPKIAVSDTIPQPGNYINEYLANATYTFPSSVSGSTTYGSASDPAICVRDGSLDLSGSVVIYGILVVKGNLKISGTVKIYGLVIVYGEDVNVEVNTSTGTPKIFGGFLLSGPAHSSFSMKGNGEYHYSSNALANVRNARVLRAYHILDWYE